MAAVAGCGPRDPFEEKLIRVTLWLKKLYGNRPVPRYEVNQRTVDILHEAMESNEERDRNVSLVIEDLKYQAAKYEAEAKYRQDFLEESLGLSINSLSQKATTDLNDLVESAMALEVEDTSLTSFYCAINYMASQLFKTKSRNQEMELKLKTLTKKLTSILTVEKQLEEDIEKITEFQKAENAKALTRSKNLVFLEKKSEDLKIGIRTSEMELIARGLDQSLTHEALVKLFKELVAVHEKLEPLKKEVESYHHLPPSIPLSRVVVEEERNELKALDEELSRQIEAVPFELT